ncbi:hypothetical protein ACRAQ7_06800 [Erythrobacter sp. W53]|uniref:hypothetical protein n=1 Tax=Erythrobacter sp. W53 TaxID=3425947 RepID=UPI003D76801D
MIRAISAANIDTLTRKIPVQLVSLCCALLLAFTANSALAQRPGGGGGGGGTGSTTPAGPALNPDDHYEFVDQNGVDLSNGQRLSGYSVDGGAAGSLAWRRGFNWDYWLHYYPTGERGTPEKWEVNDGLNTYVFRSINSSSTFHSANVDGSTFVRQSNGDYLFTDRNGNTIVFAPPFRIQGQQDRRYARYKQMASGKRYTVRSSESLTCPHPQPGTTPNPATGTGCFSWKRDLKLLGVETSDGYFIKVQYQTYSPAAGITLERPTRYIIGSQNARHCNVQAASCTVDQQGYNWIDRNYPSNNLTYRAQDRTSRERYFATTTESGGRSLTNLIDFGRASNDPIYTLDMTQIGDNVSAQPGVPGNCQLVANHRKIGVRRFITDDGTSTYHVREGDCEPTTRIAEVSYPDGSSAYALTNLAAGGSGRPTVVSRRPTAGASATNDGVNRITRYQYSTRMDLLPVANVGAKDNIGARLLKVTFPEGNYVEYDYDNRHNATQQRSYPKAGSGEPVLTTSLSFPATCSNPKTCNKPTAVTDPNGNTTNYTYAPQHGGVLTVTSPPDPSGIRAQTRYEYAQRYAWYKNASGSYVQGPVAHWLLVKEEFCKTTAASGSGCAGGASDEVVTMYDYGPNSGPNNLLLRGVVVTADGQSLRTCFGYDKMGRRISETQPKGTGGSCS